MDIKAYIESGQIEVCLTGIASEEEIREMENLCQQYEIVDEAVRDCKKTLEEYASLHAVTPPEPLQQTIWESLDSDLTAPKTSSQSPKRNKKEEPLGRKHKLRRIKYLAVAATVVLIASVLGNLYLWRTHQRDADEVTQLEHQIEQLEKSYSDKTTTQKHQLKLALSPNMKRILMAGVKPHKNNGLVLWNKNSQEVFLSLADLPEPPEGKQYQLWAIIEGKPVSAGLYNKSDSKPLLQKMKSVTETPEKFAVTLEKKGGVKSPTLSAMYVAGAI